ncbi:MAG: hypothetical protein HYT40_02995 [Candidatus Sungbacteria bacterium]|uniref:Uncharacterized protein n=1 Tax=Candidatus Sungiibacteriota bacterium TaxID=2750080 RepID=A0A931WNX1_9BACT|nr:hypothetical protein [Candidatus Sungbacteria bacterium]
MEDSFGIKLPEADRRKLLAKKGVDQFFNAGRPFGRWLEVPLPKTERGAEAMLIYIRRAYLLARKSLG